MINSVCPKCNRMGTQHIVKNRKGSDHEYLEYIHKTGNSWNSIERCYVGRVRNTDEAMGEFNKPESLNEYKDTLNNIVHDLRELIDTCNSYSRKSRVPVP